MEKQEVSPHKWAKEIIAWALGAKIETRLRDSDVWTLESNPSWFEDVEYRIYDPLREVREVEKEFKVGDWITQDNNKFVYKIEKVFMEIYNKYHLIPKNSCRKATKHEVLNASNYYGSASTQDFPLEEGDWIVHEDRGPSYKAFAYNNNSGIRNILHKYKYATKREIEVSKALQYMPFEEEDKEKFRGKWIKRKEGNLEIKITSFETLSTNTFLIEGKCSKYLFENYTFLDGTPFGKVK